MDNFFKNFTRHTFACKCGCGFNTVDVELLIVLTHIQSVYQRNIVIIEGSRCFAYNKKKGASSKSQHLVAKAADIVVSGVWPLHIYQYLDERFPLEYGVGLHDTFIHIDVRTKKARWGV